MGFLNRIFGSGKKQDLIMRSFTVIHLRLDGIFQMLAEIKVAQERIIMDLKHIEEDVTAQGTVIESAVTLLTGLKTALDAAIASNDPAQLTALSASIEAQTQALAAAVQANTPIAAAPGA
jgi:hypothetical protein